MIWQANVVNRPTKSAPTFFMVAADEVPTPVETHGQPDAGIEDRKIS